MIFSKTVSKLGKGSNFSAFVSAPKELSIYYFNSGIMHKKAEVLNNRINLYSEKVNLPYNEVLELQGGYLVTRLGKSIGIIKNEQQNHQNL